MYYVDQWMCLIPLVYALVIGSIQYNILRWLFYADLTTDKICNKLLFGLSWAKPNIEWLEHDVLDRQRSYQGRTCFAG